MSIVKHSDAQVFTTEYWGIFQCATTSHWRARASYSGTLFSAGLVPIMLIILSTLRLSSWSKKS